MSPGVGSTKRGTSPPLIEDAAALTDVIVLNTSLAGHLKSEMQSVVSDVVLKAGKPILAVPQARRGIDFRGHVLIAWDGSLPAAEALRAATPLLEQAASVTIAEIGAVTGDPADEAASYLSRHGIHARVERLDELEGGVAATLLMTLEQRQPAYCVMGAYGHSRLRESLFGGITRNMLTEAPVSLFLGH